MLPHWKEHTVTVPSNRGDFSVHYYRTGEGSGKLPLVLAHGFSDSGLCWLPVARTLEAEWDVILPDARGHGLSQRFVPGEEVNFQEDLADFIKALGLDHPVAGGHSMGASTVMNMAARNPGLIRAMILEDPGLRGTPPKPADGSIHPVETMFRTMQTQTAGQIADEGQRNNPTWPEGEWPAWADSKLQLDMEIFRLEPVWDDWREVMKRIGVPTLLITSDVEKGGLISQAVAGEIVQINPNVRVAHIPGCGHNIRREAPAAFLRAVRDFLQEVK